MTLVKVTQDILLLKPRTMTYLELLFSTQYDFSPLKYFCIYFYNIHERTSAVLLLVLSISLIFDISSGHSVVVFLPMHHFQFHFVFHLFLSNYICSFCLPSSIYIYPIVFLCLSVSIYRIMFSILLDFYYYSDLELFN